MLIENHRNDICKSVVLSNELLVLVIAISYIYLPYRFIISLESSFRFSCLDMIVQNFLNILPLLSSRSLVSTAKSRILAFSRGVCGSCIFSLVSFAMSLFLQRSLATGIGVSWNAYAIRAKQCRNTLLRKYALDSAGTISGQYKSSTKNTHLYKFSYLM